MVDIFISYSRARPFSNLQSTRYAGIPPLNTRLFYDLNCVIVWGLHLHMIMHINSNKCFNMRKSTSKAFTSLARIKGVINTIIFLQGITL